MSYDPEDGSSPASWLGAFTNVMSNQYIKYWYLNDDYQPDEVSEENRAKFLALKALADALTPCLHTLHVSPEIRSKVDQFLATLGQAHTINARHAAAIAQGFHSHPIVRDAIRMDLAFTASDVLLGGAEERAGTLMALVAERSLGARAAAYMDRATKLYLWGFEPESVVMCAAMLEAAYEERFTASDMAAMPAPRRPGEYTASDFERAAATMGLFDATDSRLAARIRRARNDTIHNVPNITMDAAEALTVTAKLLGKLFPYPT